MKNAYGSIMKMRLMGLIYPMSPIGPIHSTSRSAIQKLAPVCSQCGCRIIGHGIEAKNTFYCCANCARKAGVAQAKDHV